MTIATHAFAALLLLVPATVAAVEQDPETFVRVADMAKPRAGHTATLLRDGRVLIAGGSGTSEFPQPTASADAELYDPVNGVFVPTGAMTTPRLYHSAALLADGRVLIVGGTGDSAEVYDPALGTFAATGRLQLSRAIQSATTLSNGRVLVVGDERAELYDPTTGTFRLAGAYAPAHDFWYTTATVLVDGRVLLVGDGPTQLYDPASDSFAITGLPNLCDLLLCGLEFHTATLLDDGRALIAAGGNEEYCGSLTNLAELYDPSTGAFRTTSRLSFARAEHAAVRLAGGAVLVLGGRGSDGVYCSGGSLATAEVYDPRTGLFRATGRMNVARTRPRATVLRDGDVLVTGGATTCFNCAPMPLASAEVYRPAAAQARVAVVELYNTVLDHYFMTADAAEVATIDSGAAGIGWTHTGQAFIARSGPDPGFDPVCRFYGPAPNSHFYTMDAAECAATRRDPGWVFEGTALYAARVQERSCPPGMRELWRAYNNGFPWRPSNHRYSTDRALLESMAARGWSVEGAAMCVE